MCELLGLNANSPADMRLSFSELKVRGGVTDIHADGWGMAVYANRGCQTFHDEVASCRSSVANFIEHNPIKSKIIISHIRKANRGKICLENTHPFTRTLWSAEWSFAHKGQLNGIKHKLLNEFQPIGSTDSEYAFCYLMNCIHEEFKNKPRSKKQLWQFIKQVADEINQMGVFSFLLSDSHYLYAYCGKELYWVKRQYPFGEAEYIDTHNKVDFNKYMQNDDVITMVASQPLTRNENWHAMQKNQLCVFKEGVLQTCLTNPKHIN